MKTRRTLVQIWLLCAAIVPVMVQAQFTFTTNNDGSLNLSQYTGSDSYVIIPDTTNGLPVTSIGSGAFYRNTSVTSVTIPNSITVIEDQAASIIGAFAGCTNLTNVSIGTNVTSIGANAFASCTSLPSVTVPNSVTSVGGSAFELCTSLTNITIGTNVTSIGAFAFAYGTCLSSVTIPNSVTSIGANAFYRCFGLTGVTIGNGITFIPNFAFQFCSNLTSVTIGINVTGIGPGAFYDCVNLTSVTIPDSVLSISDGAFYGCHSLTSVTISKNITSLGNFAFENCSSLTSVYFRGNAPGVTSSTFGSDINATVYYLPGTTGWDTFSAITGLPATLWLPQALTTDASFGVRTNQFGFNINWASGQTVVVEGCTNLANPVWSPVGTNTLTGGTSYFSDSQWTDYSGRFYRLRSP